MSSGARGYCGAVKRRRITESTHILESFLSSLHLETWMCNTTTGWGGRGADCGSGGVLHSAVNLPDGEKYFFLGERCVCVVVFREVYIEGVYEGWGSMGPLEHHRTFKHVDRPNLRLHP